MRRMQPGSLPHAVAVVFAPGTPKNRHLLQVPVFEFLLPFGLVTEDVIDDYADDVIVTSNVQVQISAYVVIVGSGAATAITVARVVMLFPPGNTLTMIFETVLRVIGTSCFAGRIRRTRISWLLSSGKSGGADYGCCGNTHKAKYDLVYFCLLSC